jgi:hypothetical protein
LKVEEFKRPWESVAPIVKTVLLLTGGVCLLVHIAHVGRFPEDVQLGEGRGGGGLEILLRSAKAAQSKTIDECELEKWLYIGSNRHASADHTDRELKLNSGRGERI